MSTTVSNRVVPLASLSREDVSRAGGKAANLGEMLRAGWPVPDGFCVTCDAYAEHADGALSRELSEEIAFAYEALGTDVAVAVRSSATAEDLPDASFAGQHDTFLDVVGTEAVIDRIRACWESLMSERAVAYRRQNGFAGDRLAMACVVQRMVAADAAGVTFTADPVTGQRDRVVVNAVAGPGESLVSGRTTADQVVLRKSDGAVLQGHAPVIEGTRDRLLSLVLEVERHYGVPMDIEWAVQDGSVWLLQARPITSLPTEPVPLEAARRPLAALVVRLQEQLLQPLTPLSVDYHGGVVFPMLARALIQFGLVPRGLESRIQDFMRPVRGWPYLDLACMRDGFYPLTDELSMLKLLEEGTLPPLRLERPLLALGLPLRLARSVMWLYRIEKVARDAIAEVDRIFSPLERADMREWQWDYLNGFIRADPAHGFVDDPAVGFANAFAAMHGQIYYRMVADMVTRARAEPSAVGRLVAGLPGIEDVECAQALWDLARQARVVPAVARTLQGPVDEAWAALHGMPEAADWLSELHRFLSAYGYRGIQEMDLARPRWRERPEFLLSVMANYLDAPDEADPRATQQRLMAERTDQESAVASRLPPLLRLHFRHSLGHLQRLSVVRQNTKAQCQRFVAGGRRAILEMGRRLTEEDRLDSPDDCFYLRLRDLEQRPRHDLRSQVAAGRRDHAAWCREAAARVVDADGRPVEGYLHGVAGSEGGLRGIGSSPGRHRGRVRVVRDPAGGVRLQSGEVLVAAATDPAWTPLFLSAGAVVVEVGSVLSHASIVARELGIPSVVAVAGACCTLHDGDLVEVDGTTGTVTIIQD